MGHFKGTVAESSIIKHYNKNNINEKIIINDSVYALIYSPDFSQIVLLLVYYLGLLIIYYCFIRFKNGMYVCTHTHTYMYVHAYTHTNT